MHLYAKLNIDIYLIQRINWFMVSLARSPAQIGNIIRSARRQRTLSQNQLANVVGLRQATISLIEGGNAATKIETLLTVLAALDLEVQIVPRSKEWAQELEKSF